MISFEATLDPVNWTEILLNGTYLAFDIVSAAEVEIYFTENAAFPANEDNGTKVLSHPSSWDYEGLGLEGSEQRVWVRGNTQIRGVRA